MLSKKPIAQVQQFLTSKTDDYENWKTRRILGIQPEGSSGWFFTIHMGWWNDEEEPFVDQWKCIQETLKDPKYREGTIWLMGILTVRMMSALRTLSVTERMHRSYRIITEL